MTHTSIFLVLLFQIYHYIVIMLHNHLLNVLHKIAKSCLFQNGHPLYYLTLSTFITISIFILFNNANSIFYKMQNLHSMLPHPRYTPKSTGSGDFMALQASIMTYPPLSSLYKRCLQSE